MDKVKYINEDFLDTPTRDPIYEMADDLKKFKRRLLSYSQELYYHVIYVVVLGNRLPYVEHWKDEIRNFCKPVFFILKAGTKNIDRGKYIKSEMMAPMMGAKFEDYSVEHFKDALNGELKAGEKMLKNSEYKTSWKKIKHEMDIIRDVYNNIDKVSEKCLESIKKFYDGLCEAATAQDKEQFDEVLEDLKPVL